MARWRLMTGVFLCSASTLMLQLALTRLFSVVFFNNYAFLIVSFALLGYAVAGVSLTLSRSLAMFDFHRLTPLLAGALLTGNLFVVYLIRHVPLDLMRLHKDPMQWVRLTLYGLGVTFPFFILGLVVAGIFSRYTQWANPLYFWDLFGAATGSVALFFLIRPLGGVGAYLTAALLGLLSLFVLTGEGLHRQLTVLMLVIAGGVIMVKGEDTLQLRTLFKKRSFTPGLVEYTEWGPLTRIDVQKFIKGKKILWIDMGTNQSFMFPWRTTLINSRPKAPLHFTLPYYIQFDKPPHKVLIVGPAGGYEVAAAVKHGARYVTGVEMDTTIVKIVLGPYDSFLNGLYHHPRVRLINDEGRSFIRRDPNRYDIIQQIYNATPIAVMSGALNLAETYLLTREAFADYWNHLTDQGILSLHRYGAVRLFTQGYDFLHRQGIENPFQHMAVVEEESWFAQSFIMKKSPLTREEIENIKDYARRRKGRILFLPGSTPHSNLFSKIAQIRDPDAFVRVLYEREGIDLRPVTDDRPFFNQFISLWKFSLPKTFMDPGTTRLVFETTRSTSYTLGGLLLFGVIVGFIFILWPLLQLNRRGLAGPLGRRVILYFAGLGFGFIAVEVCLFQKLVLFLGAPVYSITFVLVTLLLQAGIGSYLAGLSKRPPLVLVVRLIPILWVVFIVEIVILRWGLSLFIGWSFLGRLVFAFLAILPMAALMGTLFPLGLRWVRTRDMSLVSWGWGVNGYTTVLGSVLAIIIAMMAGFTVVFLTAMFWYGLTWWAAFRTLKGSSSHA